jgi:hypothetical protein
MPLVVECLRARISASMATKREGARKFSPRILRLEEG